MRKVDRDEVGFASVGRCNRISVVVIERSCTVDRGRLDQHSRN